MTDDQTELVALLLAEGAAPGNSFHSWRCEHPDRYGPCSCVEESAEEILNSEWLVARDARVRAEERERIATAIEAEFLAIHPRAYQLGIKQAAEIARGVS